ncbi:MAG: phage major capsid protein [Bacteroidales bacterium]
MAEITLSDVEGLLKTVFREPIVNQIVKDTMLLNQITAGTNDVDIGARTIKHPVALTRNTKMGFRSTSQYMPDGGNTQVKYSTSEVKTLYAYIEFDGMAIRSCLTKEGAFENLIQFELKNASESGRIEINRALYGFGRGDLGVIASINSNNIVVRGAGSAYANIAPNMNWFDVGMVIEAYDSSFTTRRGSYTITGINENTRTLTLNNVTNLVAGDYLFVDRNYNNEPMGLLGIADNGTYVTNLQGISNASYPRWNGYVDTNTALRAITETALQNLITVLERAGKNIIIVTTEAIRNKIAMILQNKFVAPKMMDIEGGFTALNYNGYPIYADLYCPYGHIFGLNPTFLKIHQLYPTKNNKFSAFVFDDLDGQVLHGDRGSDIFWAKGVMDYNITTTRRNAFGRIDAIDATL